MIRVFQILDIWWVLYYELAFCWYLRFQLQIYFLSLYSPRKLFSWQTLHDQTMNNLNITYPSALTVCTLGQRSVSLVFTTIRYSLMIRVFQILNIWWVLYYELAFCWYLRFQLQIYFLSLYSPRKLFSWQTLHDQTMNNLNITYPSALTVCTLGQRSVSLVWGSYILKCRVVPSFIHLVMSGMFIWRYSYPTPVTVFFCLICLHDTETWILELSISIFFENFYENCLLTLRH